MFQQAAALGDVGLLRILRENLLDGQDVLEDVCDAARLRGRLSVVEMMVSEQWVDIRSIQRPMDEYKDRWEKKINSAIKSGNCDVVMFLVERYASTADRFRLELDILHLRGRAVAAKNRN